MPTSSAHFSKIIAEHPGDCRSSWNTFNKSCTGKVTALSLLDLSSAFDTIDHTILSRRLGDWFGDTEKALDWFKSYLTGRCWRIKLGDCLLSKDYLPFEVPPGSVFGPLPFALYTMPLSSMISDHAIPHHLYADDSQLYVSFSSGDPAEWFSIVFGLHLAMDVDE